MVSANRLIAPVQCVAPPGAPIFEANRNCYFYCDANGFSGGYCDYGDLCYCTY